ncbi:hypothetical protein [Priestia taiwanensis]|uniref:hypothetical protein n=1 Tax=Priestia taiwanensis TaxID=1347902 RepID=UPI001E3A1263|nr:hypothetical protein [Priestia taiwanensis]
MRWNHDVVTLETMREAEVWADSIANEIYGRIYEGYTTSDYKVAYALAFMLASIRQFHVHTEIENTSVYKVWITMSDIQCSEANISIKTNGNNKGTHFE